MVNERDTGSAAAPVLIAGGGIGGLAVALALARKGYRSRVLEQSHKFGEIGAGIQLGPNANRTLERLGIAERLRPHVVRVDELRLMDSLADRPILSVPLGDAINRRFGAPYYVVHRADLHAALFKACQAHKQIKLETDRVVTGFKDLPGGVAVILEKGKPVRGAALIGADGLWSKIRAQLLEDGAPRFAHHTCYRTLLEPDEMPEDLRWNTATLWAGPGTHLVHYPIAGGRKYNIVATFASASYQEGWNIPGDRDELLHNFRRIRERPKQILLAAKSWRKWSLCDRDPITNWSKGRVTLLGDAAHPMLQYFAQGAAMAMEDAVAIADMLELNGGNFEPAFIDYQDLRAQRAGRVQLEARRLGRLYHARGIGRWMRNWYMRRTPPEKILDGVAWLYDGP